MKWIPEAFSLKKTKEKRVASNFPVWSMLPKHVLYFLALDDPKQDDARVFYVTDAMAGLFCSA